MQADVGRERRRDSVPARKRTADVRVGKVAEAKPFEGEDASVVEANREMDRLFYEGEADDDPASSVDVAEMFRNES